MVMYAVSNGVDDLAPRVAQKTRFVVQTFQCQNIWCNSYKLEESYSSYQAVPTKWFLSISHSILIPNMKRALDESKSLGYLPLALLYVHSLLMSQFTILLQQNLYNISYMYRQMKRGYIFKNDCWFEYILNTSFTKAIIFNGLSFNDKTNPGLDILLSSGWHSCMCPFMSL